MIQNEFNKMIGPHLRQNLHLIPKLHKEDWKRVVEADYRRSLLEKGPISFQELGVSILFVPTRFFRYLLT